MPSAAVLSLEDVHGDEDLIEEMQSSIRILVVTEGAAGCRLYWNGDLRAFFTAPSCKKSTPPEPATFLPPLSFSRLHTTQDPWEAARFATQLAAHSVTRRGLLGVPTPAEVESLYGRNRIQSPEPMTRIYNPCESKRRRG